MVRYGTVALLLVQYLVIVIITTTDLYYYGTVLGYSTLLRLLMELNLF